MSDGPEHRKDSKTEMGKARLSAAEIELLDRVRGDVGRGVWLRDVALSFGATDPLPVIGWPPSIAADGDRNIDVGFRLTEEQVEHLNKVRGGFPLGTWIREQAIRVAGALVEQSISSEILGPLLPKQPPRSPGLILPAAAEEHAEPPKPRRTRSPAVPVTEPDEPG